MMLAGYGHAGVSVGGINYLLNITTISIPTGFSRAEAEKVFNGTYGGPWNFVFGGYDSNMNFELAAVAATMPDTILLVPYPQRYRNAFRCTGPAKPDPQCVVAGQRRFNNTIWVHPNRDSLYNALGDRIAAVGGKTAAVIWASSASEDINYADMSAKLSESLPVVYQRGITTAYGGPPNTTYIATLVNELMALDPDLVLFFDRNSGETFWNMAQARRWLPRALAMPSRAPFPGNFSFLIDIDHVRPSMRGSYYNVRIQAQPCSQNIPFILTVNAYFAYWT